MIMNVTAICYCDMLSFLPAGLSGAMSNVSVRHNSSSSAGVGYEQSNVNELHCFIMDEMSRRSETRQRTSSNGDVIMDSPSRKRSRLF